VTHNAAAATGLPLVASASSAEAKARLAQISRRSDLLEQLGRGSDSPLAQVMVILEEVRRDGDKALVRLARDLDGAAISQVGVPIEELARAWDALAPAQRAALEAARSNIRRFQEAIYGESSKMVAGFGRQLEMRLVPVRRVGLYVPGGRAAYPSSVLMAAIPARVAGVGEIVVCTPPDKHGNPHPSILAACHLAGIKEVHRAGGAQAIAAMAYGTATIKPVDLIVGPGNQYVTHAKRLVYGQVGIDQLAGPTELVIIADETARADWVAADLLAQAEHDPHAACVLLTLAPTLGDQVVAELQRQLATLPTAETCRAALSQYGLVAVCADVDEAAAVAESLAPEHLEVHTRAPESVAAKVPSAASTFVGPFAPEAAGDYVSGPSHVLPTGGTARFTSGLSVHSFLVRKNRITYQREGLLNEAASIVAFARLEGMEAHARSTEIRLAEPAAPVSA